MALGAGIDVRTGLKNSMQMYRQKSTLFTVPCLGR